jgi:acetyl esterase/lipase
MTRGALRRRRVWSVHRPISTQRLGAGLATWSDLDLAVEECVEHARRIGRVDAIAGYLLGASVAVRLNAEGVDAPLLLVAPSLREKVVEQVRSMGVSARLVIVTGERDPYLESTRTAADALSKDGAEVELQIVANLGHDFPVDFDRWLVSKLATA